ncbi:MULTISPECIES: hypothetical protein [Clostridium]|uniref:LXG domain of WXG superfamily protein n=1 Tax=Clostridium frigoriphilum TaxID=443253 RepID=A0ABU7UVD6_9CLOT|nr:hypothetical protein [Clostridium sp. DSM 17811]MBU3102487.1 hypothetical protein [Clostridium sp. DSM 17811]
MQGENQGQAIEALKDNYTELEGDLEGCKEELNDLYTIFNDILEGKLPNFIRVSCIL